MTALREQYTSRQHKFEEEERRYHKIGSLFSWLRLLAFVLIIIGIYLAFSKGTTLTGIVLASMSVLLLGLFIYLNAGFNDKRNYYKRLANLCIRECEALEYDFLEFPSYPHLADHHHAYADDLDLLGEASFFQYLNRTVTQMGQLRLLDWLKNPLLDIEEIKSRQESCRELSGKLDWRLEFCAASVEEGINHSPDKLLLWLEMPPIFSNHSRWIKLIPVWQGLMTLLVFSVIIGWVNYTVLVLFGLINLALVGMFLKKISRIAHLLERTDKLLHDYDSLFNKLKELGVNSAWLKERVSGLLNGSGSALTEINILRRLMNRFDSRNNLLIGFTRDALFLTDLYLVLKMEQWRKQNGQKLGAWLETLGEIDAMNSLATFAFNNPAYIFPEPVLDDECFEARDLGHPLIHQNERVSNDFSIRNWKNIVVLTGANMAGKSTFLRTVGLNLVIAHTGAPVCASYFRFRPSMLMTSIRTNDSLIKHESYFYAELKKLKSIVDTLEQGNRVFILLDEVLKGTNSRDKLNGSITLVRKLLQFPMAGIIATHDIALGEMEKELPENIRNYCFEADISEGQLSFDYKLRKGAAQNMTALFLMKKMGIV